MTAKLSHINIRRRIFTCGLLLCLSIFGNSVSAAEYELNQPDARVTVKLGNNSDYSIENHGRSLRISFRGQSAEELEDAALKLPGFIETARLSQDKNSIDLLIAPQITARNFRRGQNLILELNGPETISNADTITVNYGDHPDFSRFVFNYIDKPLYSIKSDDERTKIIFLSKPKIKPYNLEHYILAESIIERPNKMGGTDYILPGRLKQSFESDNKFVVDIVKNRYTGSENNKTELPATDLHPEPAAPLTVSEKAIPNSQTINKGSNVAFGQIAATAPIEDEIVSLSFPWNVPVNLSVFKRGEYLWIVFDHSQNIDMAEILAETKNIASEVIHIPHPQATILRIKPYKEISAFVRKEGLLWIVDLINGPAPSQVKDMPLFTQYDSLRRAYMFVPTLNSGNVIFVIDPEVGDNIIVSPTSDIGEGFRDRYRYPDFDILPSIQGLAIAPNSSDVLLTRGNTGITVKALDRGLNISSDLDALKRRQSLSDMDQDMSAFDFSISPQILTLNFNEAVEQLKNDMRAAPENQKDKAALELVKYYIANGLGTNALSILNRMELPENSEISQERLHALHGIANFLAGRFEEAIEDFSFGRLPNSNEAVFWRTLASSARRFKKEDNTVLMSFVSLIKDYPQELKERIALIGAETSLQANDDIALQNFLDILKNSEHGFNRPARVAFLNAKKLVMQGYPRNALSEYRALATSPSLKYSSMARMEMALLGFRLGAISAPKAAAELERLRYAWGDRKFKLELLQNLADIYTKDRNFYNALKTMQESLAISDNETKARTLEKMVSLFEDIYINNQADYLTPLKSLALYHDFEWLAPKSPHYNDIIQKLADRLVAVDLLDRASDLLKVQLKSNTLTPLQRNKVGTRLALINLFEEDNNQALKVLDATEVDNLPQYLATHRLIIRAKALSNLGRIEEALKLLDSDTSKNALLLKSEIYWNGGRWGAASDTIKYLIEKPVPGQKLSEEQIGYILDWATALKKAGRETVIVRLRNKFLPYFENTKYYSVFSILTGNLENDKIDIRAIDKTINDIAAFSNFTKIYNDSLKNSSLSQTIK